MKKIVSVMFSLFMILAMSACTVDKGTEAVYFYGASDYHGDFRYNVSEQYVSAPKKVLEQIKKEDRTLSVQGSEISLTHQKREVSGSRTYVTDRYENQELSMYVSFREDTGALETVIFGDYRVQLLPPVASESQLMDACAKIVASQGQRMQYYRSSVKTSVFTQDGNGGSSKTYDGFLHVSANPNVFVTYQVIYTYYVGEYQTSDTILIEVDGNGFLQMLVYNMTGAFDSVTVSDEENERYRKNIHEAIIASCSVDGYTLQSYEKVGMLTYVDEALSIHYFIYPTIVSAETNQSINAPRLELLMVLNRENE